MYLSLNRTLGGREAFPHFPDEEGEAERGEVTQGQRVSKGQCSIRNQCSDAKFKALSNMLIA